MRGSKSKEEKEGTEDWEKKRENEEKEIVFLNGEKLRKTKKKRKKFVKA